MQNSGKAEKSYGPCCACGEDNGTVKNFIMLHFQAPVKGSGWGCMQCGLPLDGALAVVCDGCLANPREIRWAIMGKVWEKQRVPVRELVGVFEHDRRKHPELNVN